MTAGSHHHQRNHESSVYILKQTKQNGRRIIAIKPLLMMDSWKKKKKLGKIYTRMGWISISRIIGRHDPAGKSGRVVCDLFDAFRWGDIVRVQETRKTWGSWGEILLPVCANPHLFYLVLNALYIYTITYINIYDRRWLFLFLFPIVVCFSLCYVYQEQLSPWIYQAQLSSIQ